MDTTVAIGSDSLEQSVSQINGVALATHTLVADSRLHDGAVGGFDAETLAAVRVAVGEGAHQAVRQSNLHVAGSVDVPAASTETTVVVSYVACAGIALTLARAAADLS
jgi:hypothetical protein